MEHSDIACRKNGPLLRRQCMSFFELISFIISHDIFHRDIATVIFSYEPFVKIAARYCKLNRSDTNLKVYFLNARKKGNLAIFLHTTSSKCNESFECEENTIGLHDRARTAMIGCCGTKICRVLPLQT